MYNVVMLIVSCKLTGLQAHCHPRSLHAMKWTLSSGYYSLWGYIEDHGRDLRIGKYCTITGFVLHRGTCFLLDVRRTSQDISIRQIALLNDPHGRYTPSTHTSLDVHTSKQAPRYFPPLHPTPSSRPVSPVTTPSQLISIPTPQSHPLP